MKFTDMFCMPLFNEIVVFIIQLTCILTTKIKTNRHYSNQNKISVSGINSGHHNLPTYEISLKSNNVEFVRYCGGHFENGDR